MMEVEIRVEPRVGGFRSVYATRIRDGVRYSEFYVGECLTARGGRRRAMRQIIAQERENSDRFRVTI